MTRRKFFKWSFSALAILAGCGGNTNFQSSNTYEVQVKVESRGSKSVRVFSDETVLDAIKKAYSYKRVGDKTIIDGITSNWRYSVDGFEPDIYAGDYFLTTDSIICLWII